MDLNIDNRMQDGVMILQPGGPITELTSQAFRGELKKAAQDAPNGVICDLSLVAFASSSFFGTLMASSKKDGNRLIIAAVHPDLLQTFKLAQLDQVIEIADNVNEALKLIKKE